MEEKLVLTKEWDKTFTKSDKVKHRKVTFHNRYGITLAADLYEPKDSQGKLAAVAVCGPFGAVKEQAAGLYAQTMAERGFLTIAFDPSFTGESGGQPRYMASPDINTEDFQAAVDFLSVQDNVDPARIGIIGICGWGGMALNTAALDTRIKATVASTMYDMTRVNAKGYFDAEDSEYARYEKKTALNAQRIVDYKNGNYAPGGGVVDPLPDNAPFYVKDYHDYYIQDRERVSFAFPQLQRRLECDRMYVLYEPADPEIYKRDPQRSPDDSWREGAFLLLQQRCIRRYGKGQSVCRQQRTDDHSGRCPHRSL